MRRRHLAPKPTVQPMVLGHYTLTAIGLTVKGSPTFEEHQGVGDFISHTHKASGFWLADWLRYGEGRHDWRKRLSQAVDATSLSEKTLQNIRAVAKIEPSRRKPNLELGYHAVVSAMEPEEQTEWLDKVEENGWTIRDLRQAIEVSHRRRVIDGRADTMYSVEVTVQVEVEAQSPYFAKDAAWKLVKDAVASVPHAKVIMAHIRAGAKNEVA